LRVEEFSSSASDTASKQGSAIKASKLIPKQSSFRFDKVHFLGRRTALLSAAKPLISLSESDSLGRRWNEDSFPCLGASTAAAGAAEAAWAPKACASGTSAVHGGRKRLFFLRFRERAVRISVKREGFEAGIVLGLCGIDLLF